MLQTPISFAWDRSFFEINRLHFRCTMLPMFTRCKTSYKMALSFICLKFVIVYDREKNYRLLNSTVAFRLVAVMMPISCLCWLFDWKFIDINIFWIMFAFTKVSDTWFCTPDHTDVCTDFNESIWGLFLAWKFY